MKLSEYIEGEEDNHTGLSSVKAFPHSQAHNFGI